MSVLQDWAKERRRWGGGGGGGGGIEIEGVLAEGSLNTTRGRSETVCVFERLSCA